MTLIIVWATFVSSLCSPLHVYRLVGWSDALPRRAKKVYQPEGWRIEATIYFARNFGHSHESRSWNYPASALLSK